VNIAQIKAELATIYEELIDTADGAHWSSLYTQFNDRHPDARFEVGAELYDEMLKDKALSVMKETDRRAGRRQLSLPGLDVEWDATVTLPDGEGSFRRKRLERATASDLIADLEIHRANVDSAVAALDRGTQRNTVLLPAMEEHGFTTAGEAIEYLAGT
jgi:hypothetical protein